MVDTSTAPVFVRSLVIACAFAFASAFVPVACRVYEPSNRPLDTCRRSCEQKAKRHCSAAECERGCEIILDRIVEREGQNVIACVAAGPRRCTDVVWADCATKIGAHADGGPPGPPPPVDDYDD